MPDKKRSTGISVRTWLPLAIRTAVLVLAYQHYILPKHNALPPGTQKSLWWSIKNAWKISRLYGRGLLKKSSASRD